MTSQSQPILANGQPSAELSGACSTCPLELGCGSFEVCRIMSMTDEEIIATTPDAEAVAAEMRAILMDALAKAGVQS